MLLPNFSDLKTGASLEHLEEEGSRTEETSALRNLLEQMLSWRLEN